MKLDLKRKPILPDAAELSDGAIQTRCSWDEGAL